MSTKSNELCDKQRKTNPLWISLNVRLLHRKMCYLLSWLNRRIRNRTYGGVRGRENLFNFPSYSIITHDCKIEYYQKAECILSKHVRLPSPACDAIAARCASHRSVGRLRLCRHLAGLSRLLSFAEDAVCCSKRRCIRDRARCRDFAG